MKNDHWHLKYWTCLQREGKKKEVELMIVQLAGSDVANRTASKDSSYNKRPQVINLKQKKKKQDLAQF